MDRKPSYGIAGKLRELAGRLKNEVYTLYLAYKDPRVPWYAKAFCVCVVAYAISPIDLIPDFIPVLGYLDDVVLLPFGIWLALKMIPAEVLAQCRQRAVEKQNMEQHAFVAVLMVIAGWMLIIGLSIACIIRIAG